MVELTRCFAAIATMSVAQEVVPAALKQHFHAVEVSAGFSRLPPYPRGAPSPLSDEMEFMYLMSSF